MHGVNPRTIMGQRWWDEQRQAAYRSTDYHCAACGVWKHEAQSRKWLEAHEIYAIDYLLGRMALREIVPLCHYCHSYIHIGRLSALLEQRKVSQAQYVAVVQHGNRVLAYAGLSRPEPYNGPVADWGEWRLIFNDREYPPIYQTPYDWIEEHDA